MVNKSFFLNGNYLNFFGLEDTILEKCAIYHLEEYKSVMHKREQAAKHGEDSAPMMKEFFYKYFYDIETGEVVDLAKKKTKAVRNKRQRVKLHETHKLKGSLAERFLVVPQSFLDTRLGPWRQRNQMWLSLGISSAFYFIIMNSINICEFRESWN
jgi:hypothetical protein